MLRGTNLCVSPHALHELFLTRQRQAATPTHLIRLFEGKGDVGVANCVNKVHDIRSRRLDDVADGPREKHEVRRRMRSWEVGRIITLHVFMQGRTKSQTPLAHTCGQGRLGQDEPKFSRIIPVLTPCGHASSSTRGLAWASLWVICAGPLVPPQLVFVRV